MTLLPHMVKVLSVPSHLPSWNGALFFSTTYCNACNVWNYWFWTIHRETVIYTLSFHVFHKHFSNVNFISRTSAATSLQAHYFIPKHFKTASKELNEKLLKNTSLKRKKESVHFDHVRIHKLSKTLSHTSKIKPKPFCLVATKI